MVEIFLVLYLLSGLFKALLTFGNFIMLPIDLTIAFGVLSVSSLLVRNYNQGWTIRHFDISILFLFMIFWAWMFFSLSYTSSSLCGIPKVFLFGTNFIPIIVLSLCRTFNVKLFIKTFIISILGCSLLFLPLFQLYLGEYSKDDVTFMTSYLAIGLYLGLSLLINVTSQRLSLFDNNYLCNIVLFVLLILTGARGPIVFCCICIIAYFMSKKKNKSLYHININKPLYSLFVLSFVLFIVIFISKYYDDALFELMERTMYRLSVLIKGVLGMDDLDISSSEREIYIIKSWKVITSSPVNFLFGTGAGSFGVELFNTDVIGSPHNVILEVWLEFGLVGLLLFSLLLYLMLFRRKSCGNITMYVIIYLFLNLMKSGSLQEMRVFITFFVLYSYYPSINKLNISNA